MSNPLQSIALWRASESAFESSVPLTASGAAWYVAWKVCQAPAAGRPLTALELGVMLGACVALTGWAAARQLHIYGRRGPKSAIFTGLLFALVGVLTLRSMSELSFVNRCVELGGDLARVEIPAADPVAEPEVRSVCRVNGSDGNAYLAGTILSPNWSGQVPLPMIAFLALVSAMASLGLRDWRLRPSKIPKKLYRELRLAPAAGTKAIIAGPKPKEGRIQACGNATLWGEICGQIYSADKEFAPGEWCPRCQQVFRRAERALTFSVVSLFTADIDVLNGLERLDTVSWDRGHPMPSDARISGRERWVTLGEITLPDVITVAQALALIHEQLPTWTGAGGEDVERACKLAQDRASRICGWLWFGRHPQRLTYARPTTRVRFAVGPNRLRDLAGESVEPLTWQLDIGLLPLELRTGFRRTFLDRSRPPAMQNSKLDLWIPVGPTKSPPGGPGLWVDRIEGEALRTWLSTERLRPADLRGVTSPLPYLPFDPERPRGAQQ